MTESEKNISLQEQNKLILDKLSTIEEKLAILVNTVLKDEENYAEQDSSSADQSELMRKIDELQNMLEAKDNEIKELESQLESNNNSKCLEEAREMGAYRIGAAFRLPTGYCEHANGSKWRIIDLHGDVVTLRRSQASSSHIYEEEFYIQDILQCYEPE